MFEKGILDLAKLTGVTESSDNNGDPNNHVPEGKVTIPGGLREQPTKDGITMTSKEYDDALKSFQNSFKEAANVIETLRNVRIADAVTEASSAQEDFVEDALDAAFVESYEAGPMFEAVDRSDKATVKKITKSIRGKVKASVKDENYDFRECKAVARAITSFAAGAIGAGGGTAIGNAATRAMTGLSTPLKAGVASIVGSAAVGGVISVIASFWKERMWQIIGICNIESGNVSTLTKKLNEEFKEDLEGYKILAVKFPAGIIDVFKKKFGWKNHKNTYMLLVDKKLPTELKEMKEIKESVDTDNVCLIGEFDESAESVPASGNGVTTESSSDVNSLYRNYLKEFAESNITGSPLSMDQFIEAYREYAATGDLAEFAEKTCKGKNCNSDDEKCPDCGKKKSECECVNGKKCGKKSCDAKTAKAMYKAYKESAISSGNDPMPYNEFKTTVVDALLPGGDDEITESADIVNNLMMFFDANI